MGIGASATHIAEHHRRQLHVVDIAAAAAQQPWILEPWYRRLPQHTITRQPQLSPDTPLAPSAIHLERIRISPIRCHVATGAFVSSRSHTSHRTVRWQKRPLDTSARRRTQSGWPVIRTFRSKALRTYYETRDASGSSVPGGRDRTHAACARRRQHRRVNNLEHPRLYFHAVRGS